MILAGKKTARPQDAEAVLRAWARNGDWHTTLFVRSGVLLELDHSRLLAAGFSILWNDSPK
jgi:hypothetical protein